MMSSVFWLPNTSCNSMNTFCISIAISAVRAGSIVGKSFIFRPRATAQSGRSILCMAVYRKLIGTERQDRGTAVDQHADDRVDGGVVSPGHVEHTIEEQRRQRAEQQRARIGDAGNRAKLLQPEITR